MTMKRVLILLLLAAMILVYPSWRYLHSGGPSAHGDTKEPPQVVSDAVVQSRDWQDALQAFGQVRAVQGADLSAQVPGIVDEIDFHSGQEVRKGDVLVRLRLYDDTAKLQQLQALVALWQANVARDQKQFEVQAISHATLDLDNANLRQYQAQVAAQIQAIEQKIVRAPFDGRLGIRQVDLGQYLSPGTTVTSLESLDHLYVDFNVVQQDLSRIALGQVVAINVDSYPGQIFNANVEAIDSRIDQQSRMVSVRASLDNRDRRLLPGMFAVVRLDVGKAIPAIAVPQSAISFNPYGDFVYVLAGVPGDGKTFVATQRVVVLGARKGDLVVIERGLKQGDRIVTAGQFKLRNNVKVRVDDSVQPSAAIAPTPVNE